MLTFLNSIEGVVSTPGLAELFCLLISRFLSSVSIKPMTTMLVFLRRVCVCVWVVCLWVCVRVWVWHAYLLCKRPGLS